MHLNDFDIYLSTSLRDSGIFLSLVSGNITVRAPEVIVITANMMVGIAGWMSARAATVVDNVPPIFDTIDEDPTPAALTVVGINSPIVKTVIILKTFTKYA